MLPMGSIFFNLIVAPFKTHFLYVVKKPTVQKRLFMTTRVPTYKGCVSQFIAYCVIKFQNCISRALIFRRFLFLPTKAPNKNTHFKV